MDDEDERVTEFVQILSSAVDREAENKALRAQRDELLNALQSAVWMLATSYSATYPAMKHFQSVIAKAKGESNE